MSSPPCTNIKPPRTNLKPPIDDFLATVLKMTEALSTMPFEKRANEGGNAFFITVSGHTKNGSAE